MWKVRQLQRDQQPGDLGREPLERGSKGYIQLLEERLDAVEHELAIRRKVDR